MGICEDNPVSGNGYRETSCSVVAAGPTISVTGTVSASSGNGVLSAEATAWAFRDVDMANRGTGAAQGFATNSDVISVVGAASNWKVQFTLDILGGLVGEGSSISTNFNINNTDFFSNYSIGGSSPFSGVYGVTHTISNPNFISIIASLNAQARACAIFTTAPQSCTASSTYDSSLRLLGINIFDETGLDRTNGVSVTSQSGFDCIQGATPHDRISPVPLPGSLPLLIAGLGALGYMRRRKRSTA